MLALRLGLLLLACVFLDTIDELLPRPRKRNVFYSNIDPLLDISISHTLVDYDPDSALRDVVDNTGLAVIDLVRHAASHG